MNEHANDDAARFRELAAEVFGPAPSVTACPDLPPDERKRVFYEIVVRELEDGSYVRRVWEAVTRARARGDEDLTEIEAELEAADPRAGIFASLMLERMPDEPPRWNGVILRSEIIEADEREPRPPWDPMDESRSPGTP